LARWRRADAYRKPRERRPHLQPASAPAFAESVRYAEANLDARSGELVGDRNPRELEFSVRASVTNLV
jgi:hypothetical protein